jgi:hypothetical protein
MDIVAICPVPAAGDEHVLRMPRQGMDMSFAARATGHVLVTRQWRMDMFIALRRDWACPGMRQPGIDVSIGTGWNGPCPADKPGAQASERSQLRCENAEDLASG